MQIALAVTVIGPDRPGIVHDLAELITAHEADWLDSHLANLAGQFAGIVHVGVADRRADALQTALENLGGDSLTVVIARGQPEQLNAGSRMMHLSLTGLDHPGIVRDISAALANAGVSVESLETEQYDGSMSGEAMFRAEARLRVPDAVSDDDLDDALQTVSASLMVDVDLAT